MDLRKLSSPVFGTLLFGMCVMAQLPALLGGIELADSGFYLTFYENIFNHPRDVEYNFMYYLSGVIGGVALKIFPDAMITIRILGLLANLACVACVWSILSEERWRSAVLSGCFLASLATVFMPLSFYNDTLTAFFVCLGLLMLWRGLASDGGKSLVWFMLSGTVMGVNAFSRIPNVLDVLFLILIPIGFRIEGKKRPVKGIACYVAGWILGVMAIIGLMLSLGHLEIFVDNLRDLFSIASGESSESTHTSGYLIGATLGAWKKLILYSLKISVFAVAWWLLSRVVNRPRARIAIAILMFIPVAFMLWHMEYVTAMASITLPALVCVLWLYRSKRLKIAAWMGLSMMLIMPLGSDNGIFNMGSYTFWIALPTAFAFSNGHLHRLRWANVSLSPLCRLAVVLVCSFSWLWSACSDGLYFDGTPLTQMRESPAASKTRFVHTSAAKSAILANILDDLNGEVSEGDILMVYGSAPMINYLTGTRPFVGNSWPELLAPEALKSKLDHAETLPPVMMMKFNTLGKSEWIPSEGYLKGKEAVNIFHNDRKTGVIFEFLRKNNYTLVKSTQYFSLYKKQ